MTFDTEHVVHSHFLKNELCCALDMNLPENAKGIPCKHSEISSFLSYDGLAFRNHASSKNDHQLTTLANYNGSPFVVGSYSPGNNKVELYDITTNIWTEKEDYSYHE